MRRIVLILATALRLGAAMSPDYAARRAILIMTSEQEILTLPKRLPSEENWTGRKLGPDDPNVRAVEDVVLVTETGARVLSAALPVDPDEIERALAHRQ